MKSATTSQINTIGNKYIYTGQSPSLNSEEPLIFIGFNQGKAQFVADNQQLYDVLGEPFSSDALNKYANNHDLDELRNKVDVICSDEVSCWLSQDAIQAQIDEIEAKLNCARKLLAKHKKTVFYVTDCPGGETYTQFIIDFKKQCSDVGLSTFGFTFHGEENKNFLRVAHNGTANKDEDETYDKPSYTTIFFKLVKELAYRRMDIGYMKSTTVPKLKQY